VTSLEFSGGVELVDELSLDYSYCRSEILSDWLRGKIGSPLSFNFEMWLYLFCVLFGLSLPSITKAALAKLTSSDPKELYDQADAVTLNLVGGGHQSFWFNMGWWEHG